MTDYLNKFYSPIIEDFTTSSLLTTATTQAISEEENKNKLKSIILNFKSSLGEDVNNEYLDELIYELVKRLGEDDIDISYIHGLGAGSTNLISEYINKILSKTTCIKDEDNCHFAYEPYNDFDFDKINPKTNKKYTNTEKDDIKKRFDDKCDANNGKKIQCCDAFDSNLQSKMSMLPDYLKDERSGFNYVDVTKCNNKISSIRICNKLDIKECGEAAGTGWRKPNVYEICKLKNLKFDELGTDGKIKEFTGSELKRLAPDCNYNKCNNNDVYERIDKIYNNDEKITEHYYLIDSIKKDDLDYITDYYTKNPYSINDKLLYGYVGNTIFHYAMYYNSTKCIEYLLTCNYDYSSTNKDDNSVLHIACLRGNYEAVHKLLKHGSSLECKNIHGDNALHCAVRSGSYNCVKILLQNGAMSYLTEKNKYGETPLYTAVVPVRYDTELDKNAELTDRLNFNIVKILIEYGSDINVIKYDENGDEDKDKDEDEDEDEDDTKFNEYKNNLLYGKNNKGYSLLKTLSLKPKSLAREEIRTYIQKAYYNKYSPEQYTLLLKDYPEIRPFDLDTELDENMKDNFEEHSDELNYKNLVDYSTDEIRDEELYTEKDTRALKELPEQENFTSIINDNKLSNNKLSNNKLSNNKLSNNKLSNNKLSNNKLSNNTIIGLLLLFIIIVYILYK
mgnify:CR=1 FL=1